MKFYLNNGYLVQSFLIREATKANFWGKGGKPALYCPFVIVEDDDGNFYEFFTHTKLESEKGHSCNCALSIFLPESALRWSVGRSFAFELASAETVYKEIEPCMDMHSEVVNIINCYFAAAREKWKNQQKEAVEKRQGQIDKEDKLKKWFEG